jgi:hypothetical protein
MYFFEQSVFSHLWVGVPPIKLSLDVAVFGSHGSLRQLETLRSFPVIEYD